MQTINLSTPKTTNVLRLSYNVVGFMTTSEDRDDNCNPGPQSGQDFLPKCFGK